MKKFISSVSAAALLISSMPAMNTVSKVSAEDDDIKIMCIGDSITDGYVSDYVGSYRKFIYHNLTEMGYNIDMVGSKDGGWTPTYTDETTGETWEFDNENTGYSGYAIKEYSGRSGIYETLQSTNCLADTMPDIVTLQIGTNDVIDNHDVSEAGERLEVLVNYILESIPEDSALFVTTIPDLDPNRSDVYSWFGNYRHSADWQIQFTDEEAAINVAEQIRSYNSQINALVQKKQEEGAEIYFVDINSTITDVSTQLFDGVHPNNIGYKAMGTKWAEVIDEYLGCSHGEITTAQTTTETTTTTTICDTQTTSETTTETTTTTTAFTWIPDGTTTDISEDDGTFKIADLLKLTRYVIGYTPDMYSYTAEEIKSYDLDNDGRVDVFDTILMRQLLTGDIEKFDKVTKEKFGEDFTLFPDGDNIIIYPEEYYETASTSKITSGSTHSQTVIVNIEEADIDEDDSGYWVEWSENIIS